MAMRRLMRTIGETDGRAHADYSAAAAEPGERHDECVVDASHARSAPERRATISPSFFAAPPCFPAPPCHLGDIYFDWDGKRNHHAAPYARRRARPPGLARLDTAGRERPRGRDRRQSRARTRRVRDGLKRAAERGG